MSSLPLDIRRQAKSLVEAGKTSAEVGTLLDIKPGTIREWKRRYMWDGPEGHDRPCNDDMDTDQVPAEYERVMSLDVMDTLDWIRRMPMPRRIDAILKRERALELIVQASRAGHWWLVSIAWTAEQGDSGELCHTILELNGKPTV